MIRVTCTKNGNYLSYQNDEKDEESPSPRGPYSFSLK